MSTKILTKDEINYLKEIDKQVRQLEKNNKLIRPIFILSENAWTTPLAKLYENRVEGGDGLMYMLNDQKVKTSLTQTGDVQLSTKISGGETYTGSIGGVVVGGLIAGPVGAAMGALTPHSNGVKTEQVKHDTRCLVLEISGPRGSIIVSEPFVDQSGKEKKNFQLQNFYNKYTEAKTSYKEHKKAIDEKFADVMEYKKEYYRVKDGYPNSKKSVGNKKGNGRNETALSYPKPSNGDDSKALKFSIASICLSIIPYINLMLATVSLVLTIKAIKDSGHSGKTTAALIISIITVLWSLLFMREWLRQ